MLLAGSQQGERNASPQFDHQEDPLPSYDQVTAGTPVQPGCGQFFAPLDESDVRLVVANSNNERLANIEIVYIKNYVSFYVSPEC